MPTARHRRPARRVALVLALATAVTVSACSSSGRRAAPSGPASTSFAAKGKATRLPLRLPTDGASSVITITASSTRATVATGQAWAASDHGRWRHVGPSFVAHVGVHGLTRSEHEGLTATPIGSFALTQAFGRLPDPGLHLPYTQTTPQDWWISQPGPLYNTFQRCTGACHFTTGTPNAQLYYVQPQYELAIVIDYNRFPVAQGAGSGIFLHVTSGRPTNGCVSVPYRTLVQLGHWLEPSSRPRILIGVRGT